MTAQSDVFVDLASPLASSANIVGSKAANLAILKQGGFSVPDGFCLTLNSRDFFSNDMSRTRLRNALEEWLKPWGEKARVSVRSSASDEDSAQSSAAGQYVSFVDVSGIEEICEAIEACWRSSQSEAAKLYRSYRGIKAAVPQVGVLIHRYVPADFGGVLFTADPVTNSPDLILEIQHWPDSRTDPSTYRIGVDGRAKCITSDSNESSQSSRLPGLIDELRNVSRQVEARLGHACDLEWVYEEERLWILQARPITTVSKSDVIDSWTRCNIGEVVPDQMTPLSYSVWAEPMELLFQLAFRHFRTPAGRFSFIRSRSGLLWYNIGAVNYLSSLIGMLPVNSSIGYKPNSSTEITPPVSIDPKKIARNLVGFARATFAHAMLPQRVKAATAKFRKIASAYTVLSAATQNPLDLMSLAESCYAELRKFLYLYADATSASFSTFALLEATVAKWMGTSVNPATLLVTNGVEAATIGDLVSVLRNPRICPDERSRCEAVFLERFGHRGWQELELANPTWREWGVQMLSALSDPESKADILWSRAVPSRERAPPPEGTRALSLGKKLIIAALAGRASHYSVLRENVKHELYRPIDVVRSMFRKLARGLCQAGSLESERDIYFLTFDELKTLIVTGDARLRRIATMRRRGLTLQSKPTQESKPTRTVFKGIGASPGQATGRARIRRSPAEAIDIVQGDILVADSLDIGWVPIFPVLGGIVTRMGGVLSHPCIVAREFKVPTVVSVDGITDDLVDGSWITVDGGKGVIELFNSPLSN